ncbi:MAG: hypothetical protein ACYSW8_31170 [Planctomycetota bacterium]|jgi:hypothetical protein
MTTRQELTIMRAAWILRALRVAPFRRETISDLADRLVQVAANAPDLPFPQETHLATIRAELSDVRDCLADPNCLDDLIVSLALEGVIELLLTV